MLKTQTINIPSEFKRLFDSDWREAAVYGGRFCFSGDTIISMADGSFRAVASLMVGDKVLSLEGEHDKIISVDMFGGKQDPKPMFEVIINGHATKTTYDHKYFDGQSYVPIYQLVWGIMDASQRRTLKLLCEQYGEDTHNELEGWLQNRSNETRNEPHRIFDDGGGREDTTDSQDIRENLHTESSKERNSEPQEREKDRQSPRESGVDDTKGAVRASWGDRIKNGQRKHGKQLPQNDGETGERIVAIPLRTSINADSYDGGNTLKEDGACLRWDTRFTKWKDLDASTGGVSAQTTDSVGGKEGGISVAKVYESVDVWSISTEKHHNYFANGVNVSNSLKSHTVARVLLIRARQQKTRVACFREFQSSIAESSHQLLKDLIEQYELNDFEVTDNSIVNRINGSDFLFKGLYNNEQSIKSIEGIDIAWVEEAQAVSKSSIEVLTPTVRKADSQIIYTYNRLLEDDAVHQRLVIEGRPNTLIINVNYDIAIKYGMMPDNILAEIEDDKLRRPAIYKHKWLGEPTNQERLIYRDWGIVDDIPQQARRERGWLDYGYTNDPTSMGEIWVCDGAYYLEEVAYTKGLSNKQIADIILNRPQKIPWVGDSAEPKSNDELRMHGITVIDAQKGKDSVNNGIQAVQSQRIFVTRRSVNIIRERANYMWEEDRNGRITNIPSPVFNHHMDGIRYGISSLAPIIQRRDMLANMPRFAQAERKNPAF